DILPVFFPNASRAVVAREGNRVQALYAAQYAAEKELPVVFRERDGVEEINLSSSELRDRYVSMHDTINHVVLANTAVNSSALAPRYAVRNDALLVPVRPGPVSKFRQKLMGGLALLADHGMGFNATEFLTQGTFVTLFGAPRLNVSDPMEDELLVLDDPEDGSTYGSDMPYRDINGDGRVDLNVGRMPDSAAAVSAMLHSDRPSGRPVVAASYGKPTWPQVLAHHGAGVWTGRQVADLLRREGMEPVTLVENRTSLTDLSGIVTAAMLSLAPVPDPAGLSDAATSTVQAVESGRYQDALYDTALNADALASTGSRVLGPVSPALATALGQAAPLLTGAMAIQQAAGLLQASMEYRVDPSGNMSAAIGSVSIGGFSTVALRFLLEPIPELNASSLEAHENASKLFYTGEGNGTHWLLPNKDGNHLNLDNGVFNQYNGSNRFVPEDYSGLVYDTSDIAASPGSLYGDVLASGAAGFIGHTAATYNQYTSEVARDFFADGFTYGQAAKQALNEFRFREWIFDPDDLVFPTSYWRHHARQEKTGRSFTVYGNPETVKDPVIEDETPHRRACDGTSCTHVWRPSARVVEVGDDLVVTGAERAGPPGTPPLYLHVVEHTFPAGTVIRNVSVDPGPVTRHDHNNTVEGRYPERRLQYETFRLPDGRTKLVIRYTVTQYSDGQVLAAPDPVVRVEADQPLKAAIDTDPGRHGVDVTATFRSNTSVDGVAVLKVRNRTWRTERRFNVSFEEEGTIEAQMGLAQGEYVATVYLDGARNLGPVREPFTVERQQPHVTVAAPRTVEMRRPFTATVAVTNPSDEVRTVRLAAVTRDGVQAAFFRDGAATVTVQPGERVKRELRLQAFLPGRHTVTVRAGERNVTDRTVVEPADPLERAVTAVKRVLSLETQTGRFRAVSRHGRLELTYETAEGRISITETPAREAVSLEYGERSARVVETPANVTARYELPGGSAKVVRDGGRTWTATGTVDRQRLRDLERVMRREAAKLRKRYSWEEHGPAR
ncbi:MAG: hypothetical protein SV186_06490, partial [Candidatus Nanohaloarchaea archaeon]|nr:hypothetical protein [Candidatus Nanohaloarchaea archaeon]